MSLLIRPQANAQTGVLVEVRGLTRQFGGTRALSDVSFSFDEANIFGFIGPNGAGKTTAMRIMAGLDVPTSGDVLIGGRSVVDRPEEVYRRIGYMPDSYGSYANTTVAEYLDFFARAYGLRGGARRRSTEGVTEFCQLEGLLKKQVASLSKGMKQRLCLGRALLHDPDVLILDEPAAGLDPRARVEFRQLLRILADQGKAIFISSHILADLQEICDRIAIIELGRLIATGTVEEIKERALRAAHGQHERAAAGADGLEGLEGSEGSEGLEGAVQPVAPLVTVDLRLAEPHPRLQAILAELPELLAQAPPEVAMNQQSAALSLPTDPTVQAAILARLVAAGLPICQFTPRERNLEELFMHLTEGSVQ